MFSRPSNLVTSSVLSHLNALNLPSVIVDPTTTKHAAFHIPLMLNAAYIEKDAHTTKHLWLKICINQIELLSMVAKTKVLVNRYLMIKMLKLKTL